MSEPLTPDGEPRSDLLALAQRMCDGLITVEERDQLEVLLRSDRTARDQVRAYLNLHAEMQWYYRGEEQKAALKVSAPSIPINAPGASPTLASPLPSTPVLGFLGSVRSVASRPVVWSVLAVALLFYGGFTAISWNLRSGPLPSGTEGSGPEVATVSDSENLRWSDQAQSQGSKAAIQAGEPLRIESGIVELQLKGGASLLVEAPAEWQITGENSATLKHGKLVAKVPQQAIGFTLETPTARIIDLGTEFGVEVGQLGIAEVHVLTGLVDVQVEPANGNAAPPQSLKAGQSLRIEPDGKQSAGDPATGERLTRLAEGKQDSTRPDIGYEVLFHYRLGEDDKNAKAGEIAAEQTVGTGTLGSTRPLTRVGKPSYTSETPIADSTLALILAGGNDAEGYLGKEFTELPIDNCVLEAWVRPRSLGQQVVAYLGHPSLNGFGLILENGNWSGLHGSLESIAATEKPRMNEWTHLAWVRERGHIQLFVNGTPSGPESITSCKPPEPTICIGHAPGTNPQTFDGEIDEVRLIRLKKYFRTDMLLNPKPHRPKP